MKSLLLCLLCLFFTLSVLSARTSSIRGPITAQTPRVAVVGGGPVGLAFASMVAEQGGEVTVFEKRIVEQMDGSVRWKEAGEGSVRREQAVRLNSAACPLLPSGLQTHLMQHGECVQMPSSNALAKPTSNYILKDLEDVFLDYVQGLPSVSIEANEFLPERVEDFDSVVVANGGSFLKGPVKKDGPGIKETFLKEAFPPAQEIGHEETVATVIFQKDVGELDFNLAEYIALNNMQKLFMVVMGPDGRGILSLRLDATQAEDLAQWQLHQATNSSDFLESDCPVRPQVEDLMRMYGIEVNEVRSMSSFPVKLWKRQAESGFAFSTELTHGSRKCPAFVIGDAAFSVHFWTGTGLDAGIHAAHALADSMKKSPDKQALAASFEKQMQKLQRRFLAKSSGVFLDSQAEQSIEPLEEGSWDEYREWFLAELAKQYNYVENSLRTPLPSLPSTNGFPHRPFIAPPMQNMYQPTLRNPPQFNFNPSRIPQQTPVLRTFRRLGGWINARRLLRPGGR